MTPEERQEFRDRMVELVVGSQGHDVAGAILMLSDVVERGLARIEASLEDINDNLERIWKDMPDS